MSSESFEHFSRCLPEGIVLTRLLMHQAIVSTCKHLPGRVLGFELLFECLFHCLYLRNLGTKLGRKLSTMHQDLIFCETILWLFAGNVLGGNLRRTCGLLQVRTLIIQKYNFICATLDPISCSMYPVLLPDFTVGLLSSHSSCYAD